MPHSTFAPEVLLEKNYELTGITLAYNFRTQKFQIGANYYAKTKSLDFGISIPPMLLKILYGVRGNGFTLLWEYGLNVSKIWQW